MQVLEENKAEETLLYDGSIAELCFMAPNNVNTIATAALAAQGSLRFADTRATLICDPRLETMVIDVEARGKVPEGKAAGLVVRSSRVNPSAPGAVTGTATFLSFLRSLMLAAANPGGDGVRFF